MTEQQQEDYLIDLHCLEAAKACPACTETCAVSKLHIPTISLAIQNRTTSIVGVQGNPFMRMPGRVHVGCAAVAGRGGVVCMHCAALLEKMRMESRRDDPLEVTTAIKTTVVAPNATTDPPAQSPRVIDYIFAVVMVVIGVMLMWPLSRWHVAIKSYLYLWSPPPNGQPLDPGLLPFPAGGLPTFCSGPDCKAICKRHVLTVTKLWLMGNPEARQTLDALLATKDGEPPVGFCRSYSRSVILH